MKNATRELFSPVALFVRLSQDLTCVSHTYKKYRHRVDSITVLAFDSLGTRLHGPMLIKNTAIELTR
ncbi:hypothetical protein PAE9249_03305 [Paenibacillus sp. CECT 9249]|nr:hypothetical protein PAE9249_03305 [Paenibacillus sp. CECT 9249]